LAPFKFQFPFALLLLSPPPFLFLVTPTRGNAFNRLAFFCCHGSLLAAAQLRANARHRIFLRPSSQCAGTATELVIGQILPESRIGTIASTGTAYWTSIHCYGEKMAFRVIQGNY
jgi:hypothetical protein